MRRKVIIILCFVIFYSINCYAYSLGDTLFYTTFDNESDIDFDSTKWSISTDGDNNNLITNLNSDNMSSYLRIGESNWKNYSLKFRARCVWALTGGAMHINFLESDNQNNCIRLIIYDNKNIAIRPVVNGQYGDTALISATLDNLMTDWTSFEIRVVGVGIQLYVNERLVGENSNCLYDRGGVSFSFWKMKGDIDNISVASLDNVVSVGSVCCDLSKTMTLGDVIDLNYQIIPGNATNKSVKFISGNSDILVITDDGRLRAVGVGSTTARVRTYDGQKEGICKVSVVDGMGNNESYSNLRFLDDYNNMTFSINKQNNRKLYEIGEKLEFCIKTNKCQNNTMTKVTLKDNVSGYERTKTFENCSGSINDFFNLDKYSSYNISFTVLLNDETLYKDSFNIGVSIKSVSSADKSLYFGIQPQLTFPFTRTTGWDFNFNGMSKYETFDLSMELMDWLGVNLIRDGAGLLTSEQEAMTASEQWDWEFMDLIAKKTNEKNIDLDLINNNMGTKIKDEYKDKGISWNAVCKTIDSSVYVQKLLLDRYKNYNNIFYEIGNESNYSSYFCGTSQEYIQSLNTLSQLIKQNGKRVSSSGLVAYGNKGDDDEYYKGIGEDDNVEYFSYHSHGSFQKLKENYNRVSELMNKYSVNKKVLLNETGMDIDDKNVQADNMMRKLLFAYGNGHKGAVMFTLRQYGEVAMPGGMRGYAMVGHHGDIRQSFIAYANLIDKLRGTKTVDVIANNVAYSYVFCKDDYKVVTAFCDDDVFSKYIRFKNNNFTAYDMYGNICEKKYEYELKAQPLYFVFDKNAEISDINIVDLEKGIGNLIIVLYNRDNKVVRLNMSSYILGENMIGNLEFQDIDTDGCYVKIFYFDGTDTLKPFQNSVLVK